MTEPFNESVAAAADEGKRRNEAFFAKLQAGADAMTEAEMNRHRGNHDAVTRGQRGLFDISPQDQAAIAAGQHRVQPQGGTYDWADHSDSPAPARRDLTRVNQQGQAPTVSPVLAHKRGWQ